LAARRHGVPPQVRRRVLVVDERDPSRLVQVDDLVLLTDLVVRPAPSGSRPFCGLEERDEGVLRLPYVTNLVPQHVVVEASPELHHLALSAVADPHLAQMVPVENVVAIETR